MGQPGNILHRDNTSQDGWAHEIYVGNLHVALYANGYTYFKYGDQVGSTRLWTLYNQNGSTVDQTCVSLAFGDELSCTGQSPDQNYFADMRIDVDNDGNTLYRRYSTTQGRWTTIDPAGLAAMDITNPQTWNRYAYVTNNPTTYVDLLGLCGETDATICVTVNGNAPQSPPSSPPDVGVGSSTMWLTYTGYGWYPPQYVRVDGIAGGSGGGAANNGTKVSCAGKTVLLPQNYRVQSNANGTITAVRIPLTGSYPYTSGPLTIAPNTIVGVGLEQNGALTVGVNNPIYYSAGFFGAYISSATYNNGSFTQVNGTRAVLGLPLSSSQTASGYLLNQFNQNSSLANTASLLQSVAQFGQMLVGCRDITGGS